MVQGPAKAAERITRGFVEWRDRFAGIWTTPSGSPPCAPALTASGLKRTMNTAHSQSNIGKTKELGMIIGCTGF